MTSRILVILGMHRSATSLLASWLHACGLNLGDELLGEGVGNDKGHFEDKDFFLLHERILRRNGIACGGIRKTTPIVVDAEAAAGMARLVEKKNAAHKQWGWKDPRTCLFVQEYERLMPAAKYLVVYRHYALVVDSLMRRDAKKKQRKMARKGPLKRFFYRLGVRHLDPIRIKRIADRYLATWIDYNARLAELAVRRGGKDVFVLNCKHFNEAGAAIHAALTDWGFELRMAPTSDFFDESLIFESPSRSYPFDPALKKRADALLAQLDRTEILRGIESSN